MLFSRPFFSLPQWIVQLFVSLNGGQGADTVDSVSRFPQIFWVSHIKLLGVVFDGKVARMAQQNLARSIVSTYLAGSD
jgi:hypothetical protein